MTKTPQETIIAALIAKLGGDVTISMREYMEAEDLELTRWDDPSSTGMRFTTEAPPVILEGELANELPNPYRSQT